MPVNVGVEIQKALFRAEELEASCPRKLLVRLMPRYGGDITRRLGVTTEGCDIPLGLLIRAHIATRTHEEFETQHHSCANEVLIPWEDLDARAPELTKIVEQCVAACEAALGVTREPVPA